MAKNPNKLNFVQRYLYPSKYPVINNDDGTISTHRMASAETDGKFISYPTIVQEPDGSLIELEDDAAFERAMQSGEFLEFPTDEEAKAYAEGGYKEKFGYGDRKEWEKAHQMLDQQKAFDIKLGAKRAGADTKKWKYME